MDMPRRIKDLRNAQKIIQMTLSKMVGVSRIAVTKWENGQSEPDGKNLIKLCQALKCNPDWLLYGLDKADSTTQNSLSNSNYQSVSVVSWAQIGEWDGRSPFATESEAIKWIDVMGNIPKGAFIVEVKGDSMVNPHGMPTLPEGSFALIEPRSMLTEDLNEKIIIVQLAQQRIPSIKKLSLDGPNVYLRSLNPNFKLIDMDIKDLIVKGLVIQVIQEV